MKIRDIVCDVCGNSVHQHARHKYTIKKRLWEVDSPFLPERVDLCESCYEKLEEWILKYKGDFVRKQIEERMKNEQ